MPHRRLAIIGAVILAAPVAIGARQPAAQPLAATGRIEGNVVLSPALTSWRPRFRIYSDPAPARVRRHATPTR